VSRLAIGIDVAATRGCDVVALGPDRGPTPIGRVHTGPDLVALLADLRPAVVAIDAPPGWADPGPRSAERALARRGISVFATPDATRGADNPFYAWMRTGFVMHAAARDLGTPVALETFPHAVAVALRGTRPEGSLLKRPAEKRRWRRAALEAAGFTTTRLRTIDEIDAALCAVTGWYHLEGRTETFGDGTDGVIVVPTGLP